MRSAGGRARRSTLRHSSSRPSNLCPRTVLKAGSGRELEGALPLELNAKARAPESGAAPVDDVALAAAGDLCAFERLYRAHLSRVNNLVRRMTAGRDSDELTQDIFVRLWQKIGSFRGDSAFSTWLHRLAVNVVIERFRSDATCGSGCTTARRFSPSWRRRAVGRPVDGLRNRAGPARRRSRIFVLPDVRGHKHHENRDAPGDFGRDVEGAVAPRAHDAAQAPGRNPGVTHHAAGPACLRSRVTSHEMT